MADSIVNPEILSSEERADRERRAKVATVKDAAEEGWNAFVQTEDGKHFHDDGPVEFDKLTTLEKLGLYALATGIVENPFASTWPVIMPANHDRGAYRELDQSIRRALGYSEFRHA